MFATSVAVAGVVMRVWALRSRAGALDSDEAIVGLMALHAQHGHIATTYWGQAYGGPHEALLVALLFAAGVGAVALEIVAIGLHAATTVVVWRIGRRVSTPRAAWTAAGLFWIGSAAAVLISLRSFALYGIGVFLGSLVVLQLLRVDDRPWSRRDWWLLGLLLGSGVWATPQFAWIALPALGWLAFRQHDALRSWSLAVAGAVLAGAPWIWYGATNDWETLKGPSQPVAHNGYLDHLVAFVRDGLPVVLGLRRPVEGSWLFGPIIGTALLVAAIVWFARVVRRSANPVRLLVAVACGYPFLLALSTHTWFQADGRYLYLLLPVLCLLAAATLRHGHALLVALVLVLTVAGLHAAASAAEPGDFGALEAALRARGITTGYADYWVAYRVTFDTREDVIVTPTSGSRYAPYDETVAASARPAYIYRRADVHGLLLLVSLDQARTGYDTFEAGGFVVYWPLDS